MLIMIYIYIYLWDWIDEKWDGLSLFLCFNHIDMALSEYSTKSIR